MKKSTNLAAMPIATAHPDSMDYLHADFDDIIFRNRNKEYGAYQLRREYSSNLTFSNFIALVLFLLAVNIPNIAKAVKKSGPAEAELTIPVDLSNYKEAEKTPPPPPKPPVKMPELKRATIAFKPPKVVEDDKVAIETTPPDVDDLKGVEISTVTTEGDPNGLPLGLDEDEPGVAAPTAVEVDKPATYKTDQPFSVVEQMPSFPDGEAALMRFIASNIRYPAGAREIGIEGTVYIAFVVEMDGSISQVNAVRDIGGGCGDEAIRVVRLMPNWVAGKQRGHTVRVKFTLPIKFKLS